MKLGNFNVKIHNNDLPSYIELNSPVALDIEVMDNKLCLVQITENGKDIHIIKFEENTQAHGMLRFLLTNPDVQKVFNFGPEKYQLLCDALNVEPINTFYIATASEFAHLKSPKHDLKSLAKELLDVELGDRTESNWSAKWLTTEQLTYAATGVAHLLNIKYALLGISAQKNNTPHVLKACSNF